jgi:hypothetical protein
MQTKMMRLLGVMVLLVALLGFAPAALAYRAPYADSDVTITTETIPGTVPLYGVHFTIHDPVSNQDVSGVSRVFEGIFRFGIQDGIVNVKGWVGEMADSFWYARPYIGFAVYDPAQKKWVSEEIVTSSKYDSFISSGIIAIPFFDGVEGMWSNLGVYTYDPSQGSWRNKKINSRL